MQEKWWWLESSYVVPPQKKHLDHWLKKLVNAKLSKWRKQSVAGCWQYGFKWLISTFWLPLFKKDLPFFLVWDKNYMYIYIYTHIIFRFHPDETNKHFPKKKNMGRKDDIITSIPVMSTGWGLKVDGQKDSIQPWDLWPGENMILAILRSWPSLGCWVPVTLSLKGEAKWPSTIGDKVWSRIESPGCHAFFFSDFFLGEVFFLQIFDLNSRIFFWGKINTKKREFPLENGKLTPKKGNSLQKKWKLTPK